MKKYFSVFFLSIVLFGVVGFLLNFTQYFSHNYKDELPLDNVQGIIVENNAIFIGLGSYNVVQEYDTNGVFVKQWKINAKNKGFSFWINSSGVPIASEKMNVEIFDIDLIKNLLDSTTIEVIKTLDISKQESDPNKFELNNRTVYELKGVFNKKLIKTSKNRKEIIINQPFLLKAYSGVFTPWLIGVLAMFFFLLLNGNKLIAYINTNKKKGFIELIKYLLK